MRPYSVLACLVIAACSGGAAPPVANPHSVPVRLVVLVVIDQLPAWSFAEKLPTLDAGIARLVGAGRRFVGEYPSAAVSTAAGHATLGTGAPPSEHGILGNDWYRRDVGRELGATEDATGGWTTAALRVPGIADALVRERPAAQAVAVALKTRSALLLLGRAAGLAIWYDASRRGWSTNRARPAWLDELERAHPIAPRLDYVWDVRDPDVLARRSGGPDASPGEVGTHRFGPTFPHRLADADDPGKAVVATPLGNELVLEAALAALTGEQLGRDDVPDYLSISFSAHDYVAHAWGQESWEAWDALRRLDASLATLLAALDREVGAGRYALVLTSDHGAAPMPERRRARGEPGGRHAYGEIETIAEAAAARLLGAGDWIAVVRYPNLYLAATVPPARRRAVIDAIVAALRELPWLRSVLPTHAIAGGCDRRHGPYARVCLGLDPIASGDVVFIPAAGVVVHEDDEVTATHHASIEPYDYRVPLVVVAPGVKPGVASAPVSMLRVAPTIARWLGVSLPRTATLPLPE